MTELPQLVDVEVTARRDGISITPVWSGVDRPRSYTAVVNRQALASRLVAAIRAGKAITVTGIGTDVNNQTYAETENHFLVKRLNADLRKLGF
jgi:predicted N-formylglutamate amidohydrolase